MIPIPTSSLHLLTRLFTFLRENHRWNLAFQRSEYWCNLAPCRSDRERLQSLLNMAVNTQSAPKLGKLASFWRDMHEFSREKAPTRAQFCEFLECRSAVKIQWTGPWDRLFQALSVQKGWGPKTAALFVKSAIVVHADADTQDIHFWQDEGDIVPTDCDRVYLPVDRVIMHIFEQLNVTQPLNFASINKMLIAHYSPTEMLIWDDLWFWGYFTQDAQGDKRVTGWNSDKFWCQRASPVDSEEEVQRLALRFIDCIRPAPEVL